MNKTVRIGIVGATGYTGVELLRLLAGHGHAEVVAVTSRQEAGRAVADLFPNLRGCYDLTFSHPDHTDFDGCDVVFFATPNGVAMKEAPALLARGIRVVDLSADYRIKDVATWEHWYKLRHESPEWIAKAVYGLPEMNREAVAGAQLIANPGCYPTCVTLALLPLLQRGCLKAGVPLIADCKSGVSGAGRKAEIGILFAEVADNFKAYGVAGHRHLPEIRQSIAGFDPVIAEHFVFVPHLTPLIRGMQATIYLQLKNADTDVHRLLNNYYAQSGFVDVLPQGMLPETRSVRGVNVCRIAVQKAPDSDTWVLLSVIDNLVKGAAGQAVQNMNVMFALPENSGLTAVGMLP